jgi:hypothetical protein
MNVEEAWEFAINESRRWAWRTVDPHSRHELRPSAVSFETLLQRVADAATRGCDRRARSRSMRLPANGCSGQSIDAAHQRQIRGGAVARGG